MLKKPENIFGIIFFILGVIVFEINADLWFPRQPGSFDFGRIMLASLVGTLTYLSGSSFGQLIERRISR